MHAEITRFALDRIPITLIIDDSAPLVNLNYFFMRDRNQEWGENHRWEDVPVVIPESFTREWAEWCGENGVKGKFSVIPCPAGLGRIDQGLPLFGQKQLDSWLDMCRTTIVPNFDITPEMLTHTHVLDIETMRPFEPRIWEQGRWKALPIDQEELVTKYITLACQILVNVGMTPEGITSPGGFGGRTLEFYARVAGPAIRSVTKNPTPYFFCNSAERSTVWFPDRAAGTAVAEIVSNVADKTGSWTGYAPVSVEAYITKDLKGGRVPELISAGEPVILCSHWQGFYGMHDDDRRGFNTLKSVVKRIRQRDPHFERTQWRRVGEIMSYQCAQEMAELKTGEGDIVLDLPVRVPELTLKLTDVDCGRILVDGQALKEVHSRREFADGTFYKEGKSTLVAFTPDRRKCTVEVR